MLDQPDFHANPKSLGNGERFAPRAARVAGIHTRVTEAREFAKVRDDAHTGVPLREPLAGELKMDTAGRFPAASRRSAYANESVRGWVRHFDCRITGIPRCDKNTFYVASRMNCLGGTPNESNFLQSTRFDLSRWRLIQRFGRVSREECPFHLFHAVTYANSFYQ